MTVCFVFNDLGEVKLLMCHECLRLRLPEGSGERMNNRDEMTKRVSPDGISLAAKR